MAIRVLPYVTIDVDDRLRRRVRRTAERIRLDVRSYLLSAADDVDTAGERVRDLCGAAAHRVDTVVARVNDRIDPAGTPRQADRAGETGAETAAGGARLEAV
jgi:hypothetical protein